MKKLLPRNFLFILFIFLAFHLEAQIVELNYLSSYYTDIFNDDAAEAVAFDPGTNRLFFTNAGENQLVILDIENPSAPALVKEVDLSSYGREVNTVDVYEGLVAVALNNANKQGPGRVVFFDSEGAYINDVRVGANPDMLTFTSDGKKVLVANEGVPSQDYTNDPEGTVSIIDLGSGAAGAKVKTVDFTAFNDKKASLQNKGVRIFGPDATVAQDLEPEYITLNADNSRAYVALQENNAVAVINVNTAEVLDIYGVGEKNHLSGTPSLTEYRLNEIPGWPALGKPAYGGGQPTVMLGGFSGLYFDPDESDEDTYVFYTIPDRGPVDPGVPKVNVVAFGSDEPAPANLRPFKLPQYQARIVKFSLNRNKNELVLEDSIFLRRFNPENNDTLIITGKGNVFGFDEIPVTYSDTGTIWKASDWVDTVSNTVFTELPYDAYGGDFEGIVRDKEGNFWLCDEYRPALYKIQPNGVLIDRFVPEGTAALVDLLPLPPGFFGKEVLPKVYIKRWDNRGFEAIAYDPEADVVYGFLQSPMHNPDNSTQNNSDVIRIIGISARDGKPVSEYVYLLERNREPGLGVSRVDNIGDAVFLGNGRFMVLERDSSVPEDGNTGKKFVFEINVQGATNILGTALSNKETSTGSGDKTLEMMTADDLAAAGIVPVHKSKVVNLPSVGYLPGDKVEGLALLPGNNLAVLNDNDFGVAGVGISDVSSLGIIEFKENYQLDASDRDNKANIQSHPVSGMLQPDAMTAFTVGGATYYLTANGGAPREYGGTPGLVEGARVSEIFLDPDDFENAGDLQLETNLGRFNVSNTQGDLDGDGLFDKLYGFGGRSFSIFDEFGNLLFDSGDDFEVVLELGNNFEFLDYFNSDFDDNDSFDSRSDDRGPEPKAITIGEMDGKRLAFIGLERMGGIMIYDLTDLSDPAFVSYNTNRNFTVDADTREAGDLGVSDIVFISGDDSPLSMPLLVTANRISGTVSIYSFDEVNDVDDVGQTEISWRLYPNPIHDVLLTNIISDYEVFTTSGRFVMGVKKTDRLELHQLPAGTYLLRDRVHNRSKIFVKH